MTDTKRRGGRGGHHRPNAVDMDAGIHAMPTLLNIFSADDCAAVVAEMPPEVLAVCDQINAHRRALVEDNTANGGSLLDDGDVPEWLPLGYCDAMLSWERGTARTCLHNPDFRRGALAVAAAWKPGLIACLHFEHLFATTDVQSRTCDLCGHVTEGLSVADGMTVVSALLGNLTYRAGVRNSCRPAVPTSMSQPTKENR